MRNAISNVEEMIRFRDARSEGIKFALLGGIIGCLLSIFLLCFSYLVNDRVYSKEDFNKHIPNVTILGCVRNKKKSTIFSFIDLWLEKIFKEETLNEKVYQYISEYISPIYTKI